MEFLHQHKTDIEVKLCYFEVKLCYKTDLEVKLAARRFVLAS